MSFERFREWKRGRSGLYLLEDRPVGLVSNIHVRVEDKDHPGVLKREHRAKNTITNVALLVDIINGVSSDHLASGANLRIDDSTPTLIKEIGTQRAGFPTASSGASITLGWEDLTTDAYNPDDLYMETQGGVTVAQTLNVAWSNKLSSENWFFDWDVSASGTNFQTAGLDDMLDALTGGGHFDGTEGGSFMRMEVFDFVDAPEFNLQINNASSQPTSSQLRFTFTQAPGPVRDWGRVETQHNPGLNVWYDDDIANQTQAAADAFEYELTVSFS